MNKWLLVTGALLINIGLYGQQSEWERSVQKKFDDAFSLYKKRLYNPARAKFEDVLKSDVPTHTRWAEESSFYRAMCALYLYNKDAEALLTDFALTYPASPLEQKAAFAAADYYFNKRQYKKSKDWFTKVDRSSLANPEQKAEYFFKLGYSQYMAREREAAKLSFLEVKDVEAKYGPSAKYYYAHIAYEDSNYVTALANFQPLLDDQSFGPVVPYYLAHIYYARGEYDELIAFGEPLLQKATAKRKPEIAKLLGEAYLKKEAYAKAVQALEFYRESGGQMAATDRYSLGFAYYKTQQYQPAIQEFNKISGKKGNMAQNAYYHLADCYLKTGNKSEALTAFKVASESGDDAKIQEDALFNYAKLNYELANPYGSAIEAFQSYLTKYPNAVKKEEANKYLANLYLTTKDYENALKALSNTGLDGEDMQEAYQKVSYFRGVQLYNASDLKEARALFKRSLKFPVNPTYIALAHFWIAESYYKQEDYKESLNQLLAFENTSGSYALSEFAEARYTKAYCYFMLDNYPEAITSFRLYLNNKSAKPRKKQDAELRLGDAYFMQRKYVSAISFYNKYLSYAPSDADYALFQKALCQGLAGKRNDKIATLNKLVQDYPQSRYAVDGKYEQGVTLLAMDENERALTVFQSFVQQYPQSKHTRRARLNMGLIYRNSEQYEKSIAVFKQVVNDYPATPEANEAIGFARLVYARLNRIEEYVDWVEGISFADIKRTSLDSNMYSTAFDFYSLNNCAEAIKAFKSYLNKFPDGVFMIKSNYYLGECAYTEHEDALAEEALKRVVNEPRSEYTERSIAMLASIMYTKPDYDEALSYYEQLLGFSEEIDQLRKARTGAMRCAVNIDNPVKALTYAEMILADERSAPEVRSEAMLVKARSLWKSQDLNGAHQAYEEIKSQAKGEPQAEACYYIANIQNQRGEYVKSNETIFWMIDNLPSYQLWRFKSLLIMADNYYQTDDVFQANYTLDFIIDAKYDPELVKEAQSMKQAIQRALEAEERANAQRDSLLNETVIEIEETEIGEGESENEELEEEGGGNP
jgi:TolA-binding protein